MSLDTFGEVKRNFASTASLQGDKAHGWISQQQPLLRGKGKWWVSAQLPNLCRMLLEKHVSLQQHPEHWGGNSMAGGRGILEKRQIRRSKGVKEMQFLLIDLRISAGSPPTSLWENLPREPLPIRSAGTPNTQSAKPTPPPTLQPATWAHSRVQQWERAPVTKCFQENGAGLWAREEPQI